MKIFYICDNDLGRQAGDTVHIVEICENLQRLGHEITLYAPRLGHYEQQISFKIRYIFSFEKGPERFVVYQIILFFNLLFDLLLKKPDIIFARASWSPVSLLISKLFRKPYIIEMVSVNIAKHEGNYVLAIKSFILRFLSNLSKKFADILITTTLKNAERLNRYYGIDKKRIEIVPSGVNTDLFKEGDPKRARQLLGLTQGFYYIGIIGSIFDYSGIDSLIKCLPLVLEIIPNLKIILAGRDEAKGFIPRLITQLKLEDHVLFIGEISYRKVPLYVGALDIGLQLERYTPCFRSGDPIKLYECFALGKAAIVSNTHKDLIEEINAGIAVDVDNPKEITEAIICLIKDEKRRLELGQNGRRFVLENRTWRLSALKTAMICENLLKSG